MLPTSPSLSQNMAFFLDSSSMPGGPLLQSPDLHFPLPGRPEQKAGRCICQLVSSLADECLPLKLCTHLFPRGVLKLTVRSSVCPQNRTQMWPPFPDSASVHSYMTCAVFLFLGLRPCPKLACAG